MRKLSLLLCLVAVFGLSVVGCSSEENNTPTAEDAKDAAGDAADKAKDAAGDAKDAVDSMKKDG